jgi:NDP-sugar pyrophosphorylase family protein
MILAGGEGTRPRLIAAGEVVRAWPSDDYLLDIGRHDDYEQAQEEFEAVRHRLTPPDTLWSVQSTPNPSKSKGDTLAGVSCVWITGCYSVGSYTDSSSTLVTLGQKYFG